MVSFSVYAFGRGRRDFEMLCFGCLKREVLSANQSMLIVHFTKDAYNYIEYSKMVYTMVWHGI